MGGSSRVLLETQGPSGTLKSPWNMLFTVPGIILHQLQRYENSVAIDSPLHPLL